MTNVEEGQGGSGARPVRVLIVEDHQTFAEALTLALEARPEIRCEGIAATVDEALDRLERRGADVVVMDVALPGLDGIEGTARVRASHPQTRVVVVTGHVDSAVLAAAVEAGASAFLPKDGPLSDLVEAILSPPGSGLMIGARTPLSVISEAMRPREPGGREDSMRVLTPREVQVLTLLGQGLSPAAVAERLGITMHTCRGHIKSVLAKLEAHSQLEAVVLAWQRGLIRRPGMVRPSGRERGGG
jgi:DNA-binding NarL/FixJ family response regulator